MTIVCNEMYRYIPCFEYEIKIVIVIIFIIIIMFARLIHLTVGLSQLVT